jgi:pyrroloquinoline quinone (PQQ) biosynthesis protein C
MDKLQRIDAEWEICYQRLARSEFFRKLDEGSLELNHYKGFLRESYHNTRQNPGTMAMFVAHVESDDARLKAKFLKHAAMEMGHDELALDDLQTLGEDVEGIRHGRPLVATEAMSGFVLFQIQHRNPLASLGYSYHLETLPVRIGASALASLLKSGVPADAFTFLKEHVDADPVHTKWNREYIEGFVQSSSDLDALIFGLRGACELHGMMFQSLLDASSGTGQSWTPAGQTAAVK